MKVKEILIAQPAPLKGSPYTELIAKHGVNITFCPFFKTEPVSVREFRSQKVNILDYTAIVFTARATIDAFFKICEEMRIVVPETMKYFCTSEAIALYLQKYIVYRKRKIFFGTGTPISILDAIGVKHKGEKFLITTTADNGKTDLMKQFTKAKLKYSTAVLVRTVNSDLTTLDLSKYEMLVFYSPSDVKSLLENYPDFKQEQKLFVTYGPTTAKAMKSAKIAIEIAAPTPESPSIAQALMRYFEETK